MLLEQSMVELRWPMGVCDDDRLLIITLRPSIWLIAADSFRVHSSITFGLISFMNNIKALSGFLTCCSVGCRCRWWRRCLLSVVVDRNADELPARRPSTPGDNDLSDEHDDEDNDPEAGVTELSSPWWGRWRCRPNRDDDDREPPGRGGAPWGWAAAAATAAAAITDEELCRTNNECSCLEKQSEINVILW